MLGTAENALIAERMGNAIVAAYSAYASVTPYNEQGMWDAGCYADERGDDFLAPGWKFLASGGSRIAFLGPDDVVYKYAYEKYEAYNICEFENYQAFAGVVADTGIARLAFTYLWNDIICMEYVQGREPTNHEIDDVCHKVPYAIRADLGRNNAFVNYNNEFVIVDFA